jgi:acetolactate synthase-1/2/3 large subunit
VLALDAVPGTRSILGLFEGVCTGAADGYARVAGRPALTLLHLGPGLANGIANLHNARRAHTPIVNLIGEHATWHLAADPPLAMDIAALTGTLCGWTRTCTAPGQMAQDMADAIAAAQMGQIANLIVPHDLQLAEVPTCTAPVRPAPPVPVDSGAVAAAADRLRRALRPALILGGKALTATGLRQAGRVQAATGCSLLAETLTGTVDRGGDLPDVERIPYFPERALAALGDYDLFVLLEARTPVAFFGYPGGVSSFVRADQPVMAFDGGQDAIAVLAALADALDAPAWRGNSHTPQAAPALPTGPLTAAAVGEVLAACVPEGAIVVNEGVTTGQAYTALPSAGAPAHTLLNITGGAIGFGLPCAVGAAVAAPGRPVIDLQADGSAMYTVQALWTAAREKLDITVLLCSNRRYQILDVELRRAGVTAPGPAAAGLANLADPAIGWVQLAESLGVAGERVTTAEALAEALRRGVRTPGPKLLELTI